MNALSRGHGRAIATMSQPDLPTRTEPSPRAKRARDPVATLRAIARKMGAKKRALGLAALAEAALAAFERGEPRPAMVALSRLALALPRDHAAAAGVHAALAYAHWELGRHRRALIVAGESQRIDPRSALAAAVAERAYQSLFPVVR